MHTDLYVSAEGMAWINRCLMAGATQLSPNVTTSAAPAHNTIQEYKNTPHTTLSTCVLQLGYSLDQPLSDGWGHPAVTQRDNISCTCTHQDTTRLSYSSLLSILLQLLDCDSGWVPMLARPHSTAVGFTPLLEPAAPAHLRCACPLARAAVHCCCCRCCRCLPQPIVHPIALREPHYPQPESC